MNDFISAPDAGDLDSLLGAYALDALDAADRARVDAYLERDAAARAEVDEMRETAAALALLPDSPMDAPPEIWERIAREIAPDLEAPDAAPSEGAVDPPDSVDEVAARRARAARPRWMAPVAAAAAIAIVLLSVEVANLRGQVHRAHQLGSGATAAAFDRAAKLPGAREVGLLSGSGGRVARLVWLPDGSGYMKGDDLAPLPPSQTYQLWALTGSASTPTAISAGVLGPDPSAVGFHASGPVHGFAVTVEQAGGVVQSHQTPVASAQLS